MASASAATPAKSAGYEVARPMGRCAITGQEIAPGEKFMAALRETPTGFERVDVSLGHWDEFDRKDVVAFWHATMPQHEQRKKLFVDDTVLCELFDRLGTATDQTKLAFRFMLGLILMRKRLIVYESGRQEQDRSVWAVRMKGSDQTMDLIDPKLSEQQMTEVSRQMSEILNEEMG